MFKTVKQEALVRIVSDHLPLILDTNPFNWGPGPFRFENMWFTHKDFLEEVRKWWVEGVYEGWEGHKFMRRLDHVKWQVKKWNKEVFGDVRIEKRRILKRIGEIDAIENSGLMEEELKIERAELKGKFEGILMQEDISWNQKAKIRGVREWDGNSRLFHRIMSQKKVNIMIW